MTTDMQTGEIPRELEMTNGAALLQIDDLRTHFFTHDGVRGRAAL